MGLSDNTPGVLFSTCLSDMIKLVAKCADGVPEAIIKPTVEKLGPIVLEWKTVVSVVKSA